MAKIPISPDAIAATVREIEEPLITSYELAGDLGLSQNRVSQIARALKIPVYRVLEGGHYLNAYDKAGVHMLLAKIKENVAVVRKNRLTLEDL